MRASRVHVFTMKDIDRRGMAAVAEEAVRSPATTRRASTSRSTWTCAIRRLRQASGRRSKAGSNYREAHLLMEIVADSGRLTSLDLVEVNPTLDVRNTTAQLGTELALSALGLKIL